MDDKPTQFFSLKEIADWQLNADSARVGLPALQRGYVWKPKQVETLWDSLLRGFPIGSFLIAENSTNDSKNDLLDGQQRATAIAMGFYNPWEQSQNPQFFSNKFKDVQKTVPILWIDLDARDEVPKGEKGDFIFLPRIVTQSHPWGYNYRGDILGISHRRNAMANFNKGNCNYPHYNLMDVYPWMVEVAVPIAFLIFAIQDHPESWREVLFEKCRKFLFQNGVKSDEDIKSYFEKLRSFLDSEKSTKIEFAFKTLLKTEIPVTYLKQDQLESVTSSEGIEASTLFVRINTSGTSLSGEELIYSMYKTAFPKSKEIVEDAGAGFISPSRIISLISRIILTDDILNSESKDFNFPKSINPKQFNNYIEDKNGLFKNQLKDFTSPEHSRVTHLFNQAKKLLVGEKGYQLPFPLAAEIARNSDVFFVVLYWLHTSNVSIEEIINDKLKHKKILAAITSLCWFTIKIDDYLKELALQAKNSKKFEFWNFELFQKVQNLEIEENKWLTFLPSPIRLNKILCDKFNSNWEAILDTSERPIFYRFREKLYWQRGLLLFGQRSYINEKFNELQWETILEDTHRPWDWDHLYPDVYNQKGTYPEIRELNNTIGNKRAWALQDNRRDQAKLPKDKFGDEEKMKSLIKENDWFFWEKIDSDRITVDNSEKAKNVCMAIYIRMANIYSEWYNTLGVDRLFENEQNNHE